MTSRRSPGARAALVVAAAGTLFTIGLLLAVSEPGATDAGGWPVLALFVLFAVSPYVALALVARRITGRLEGWAAFATSLLIAVPAVATYVLAFFIEPDAQSGLIVLFMPLYQFLAGLAALAVSAIVIRLSGARVR